MQYSVALHIFHDIKEKNCAMLQNQIYQYTASLLLFHKNTSNHRCNETMTHIFE